MMEDLWYKNAVIYSLDVETFMDGNGDGIGDFRGLRRRLEYLSSLGVTCLWLLPFYPSPNRDNGYDVSDYYGVDPRLGDLGDFVAFSKEAKEHGIRIMVDLVANHTSDQHPWFQRARTDPSSPYRDYYLWSREEPKDISSGVVFPGQQKRTWTYDEAAGAYYFHRFFSFQPDLNIANPAVREEILKVMGFWLELGVSGFRVDAVPFLIERQGQADDAQGAYAFDLLSEMREFLSFRRGDAVMLAEANVPMQQIESYFSGGERVQLAFNFIVNQALFLTLAESDPRPLAHTLRRTLHTEKRAQWANFLRNHDELDLGRLSDADRARAFAALGPAKEMQLYGRGLRRRLAPMLDGDPARLRLAYSLLLTLPGTPVFWYGEEIGMGELLELDGRHAVRTPMHWSNSPHAGFSSADELVRPVVTGGRFGYEQVNVAAQVHDPASLLRAIERMIRARRACAEIGWGEWEVLDLPEPSVLGVHYRWQGQSVLVLHNFADRECEVQVEVRSIRPPLMDVLTGSILRSDQEQALVSLEPFGFRWLRSGGHDGLYLELPDDER